MEAGRRRARRVGAVGFVLALVLPFLLFGHVIGQVATGFRLDARYLLGWAPWTLMALGLLFFVPVAVSAGGDPESRWYPRARNAYAGWGITLYVLGFCLATQVAQLTQVAAGH